MGVGTRYAEYGREGKTGPYISVSDFSLMAGRE